MGAVGSDSGISDFAIKKMSDRTYPLMLKHILKKNAYVEKAQPVSRKRAAESSTFGGVESTWINEYDFKVGQSFALLVLIYV